MNQMLPPVDVFLNVSETVAFSPGDMLAGTPLADRNWALRPEGGPSARPLAVIITSAMTEALEGKRLMPAASLGPRLLPASVPRGCSGTAARALHVPRDPAILFEAPG